MATLYLRNFLDSYTKHHDPMSYRYMDYTIMRNVLKPYVSFFRIQPGMQGTPVPYEKEVHIMYDAYQTALWTRFTYNLLTSKDIADLDILSPKELVYEKIGNLAKTVDRNIYLKWGRMISNIAADGQFPPKYEECFRIMCKGNPTVSLPERAVVYSEFAKSTETFLAFLEKKSRDTPFTFNVVTPQDTIEERASILKNFAEGNIQVLVLYAGMYEGISILGAQQMHILDSPMEFNELAQLMGRVSRINSHIDLPPSMQKVTYYHYVSAFSPKFFQNLTKALQRASSVVGNEIAYFKEFLRLWMQSQTYKQKLPSLYNPSIMETTTPEALVAGRLRPLREFMRNLETTLSQKMDVPPLLCCPLYEDDQHDPECLGRGLQPCDLT